jgi:polyhydroxybutyrate depolymerase
MMARAGLVLPDLPLQSIAVNGEPRTFSVVPGSGPDAPLLLALHGAGGTGLGMAALTGLAQRGPAAGCAVAFPDGFMHVWNDRRGAPQLARRERINDVAFMQVLVEHLRQTGVNDGTRVYAVGISNGGFLAEHLARNGLLDLAGVVLVASSATVSSRQARPVPAPVHVTRFLAFHGTADPLVPYGGGLIGPLGRLVERRADGNPTLAGRGMTAPIEDVAADWCPPPPDGSRAVPHTAPVAGPPGDIRVEWLSWAAPDGSGVPAELYRIVGGGHTWPGGAQYLPARFVGRVAAHLDATGILLDFATRASGRPGAQ